MIITFHDMEDATNPLHGTVIHDNARLSQILRRMQRRDPFSCKLGGQNGFCLDVSIGKVGCVQYSRGDGSPPYLSAVASGRAVVGEDQEFLAGGTSTPVEPRFCLPFDVVIAIATYFRETGSMLPSVPWEEI